MQQEVQRSKFKVKANIFDQHLSHKVSAAVRDRLPENNMKMYYAIEVIFDQDALRDLEKLRTFVIENPRPYEKDTVTDKIYDVLSQQLNKVEKVFTDLGYDISNAAITGEAINAQDTVELQLYEKEKKEYTTKGKVVRKMKVHSINPTAPFLREKSTKLLAEMFIQQFKKEMQQELEKDLHTPNLVKLEDILKAVSKGKLLDERIGKKAYTQRLKKMTDELISNCDIKSAWPLVISGRINGHNFKKIENFDMEIDCPEFMLFCQHKSGDWQLKRIVSLMGAQQQIAAAYKKKHIVSVVLIRNLEPVPFALTSETDIGTVIIDKKDAAKHEKIQALWFGLV